MRGPITVGDIVRSFLAGDFFAEHVRCLNDINSLSLVRQVIKKRYDDGFIEDELYEEIQGTIENREDWHSYPSLVVR